MSLILAPAKLAAVAPDSDAEALAPALTTAAAIYGINTPLRLAHWLAQIHVETQAFTRFEENLDYTAQRLTQVWPRRFPTLAAAQPYAGQPEKLANLVYARAELGNTQRRDGWRFRGRGAGLTGRTNYRRIGQIIGVDLETAPDLASQPLPMARAAGAFWQIHNLNPLADHDDVAAITETWNGGLIGLNDRRAALARYKAVLGVVVA